MAEEEVEEYVVGVEPGADEEPEPDLYYEEDAVNLVPIFEETKEGQDAIEDITIHTRKTFDADWESNSEMRSIREGDWDLFAGKMHPKPSPWENCANGHVPMVLENITRLQARSYSEIFGGGQRVVSVMPVGPDKEDEDLATLLSHHSNWQIREKIPDFFVQQSRGLLMFYLWGDVVSESSYDHTRRQNHHEMLRCDEFVVPYMLTSTQPDFSDCPHMTRVRYMQRHEVEDYRGIWHDIDRTLERTPDHDDAPNTEFADNVMDIEGQSPPTDGGDSAPYKILQWDGWIRLPNQSKERFCRVIYDYNEDFVLSLSIREEADWQERIRHERQTADLDNFRGAMEQWEGGKQLTEQAEAALAADLNLLPEQKDAIRASVSGISPEAPEPIAPEWMKDSLDPDERPKPMHKVPIHMFAHATCIDNLAGNLGLGIGRIEADLNIAADTLLNQAFDAQSLANGRSVFLHEDVEFRDGEVAISPGSYHYVEGVEPGMLANNIMPVPVAPANPQLMDSVFALEKWAQSAVQAPAVLSGEAGKSGETARGLTARIEQATKQTSVAAARYGRFVLQQMRNNFRLNGIFLDDEEFFMVNNHMGSNELMSIGRAAYQRNYMVELVSNMKFTTEDSKKAAANEVLQGVLSMPATAQNPALVYDATVQWMKAMEQEQMIPKLGQPPQVQPELVFALPPPPQEEPPGA